MSRLFAAIFSALPLLLPPSTVLAQGKQPNPPVFDRVKAIQMDLESKNPLIKKAALGGAALLFHELRGMAKFVPKLLEDPDEDVRYEAAKALEELGPLAGAEPDHGFFTPTAVLLGKALFDKSPKVRLKASYALGQMGALAAPAVPDLIKALKSKDVVMRRRAASVLGVIGPAAEKAVPALIEALDDPDRADGPAVGSVLRAATGSLGLIGPKAKAAVPRLMKLLASKDNNFVRSNAVLTLARICGAEDPEVIKTIIKILEDPNERDLHSMAAWGVMEIGPGAKAAVPTLIGLLDTQKVVQYQNPEAMLGMFISALGSIGPEAKKAVPHLANLVKDKNLPSSVRRETVVALGRIGPAAKEALPALAEYFQTTGPKDELLKTFLKIGPDSAPYLIEALKKGPLLARFTAARGLGLLGQPTAEVLQALEEAVQSDPDLQVRDEADLALKRLKMKKAD